MVQGDTPCVHFGPPGLVCLSWDAASYHLCLMEDARPRNG